MKSSLLLTGRLLLIFTLASTLLAGCGPLAAPQPTPVPTQDPATLVAAAVNTLSAQMTADALSHPSPTPLPTNTPLPTATPVPPTATPVPFTPTPEATATPTMPALSAKAVYPSTYPVNKREFIPNETFGLAIGFINNGSIAWDSGYTLKLISFTGEATVQTENIRLGKSVPPGGSGEFDLWAFGSETITTHTWTFQMYTSSGIPVPGGVSTFSYTSITN